MEAHALTSQGSETLQNKTKLWKLAGRLAHSGRQILRKSLDLQSDAHMTPLGVDYPRPSCVWDSTEVRGVGWEAPKLLAGLGLNVLLGEEYSCEPKSYPSP